MARFGGLPGALRLSFLRPRGGAISYVRDGQEWPTYGAYLRSKSLRIEGCRSATGGSDRTAQKRWDAELSEYRSAVAQGINPAGTKTRQIRAAVEASNRAGKAFDAATNSFKEN